MKKINFNSGWTYWQIGAETEKHSIFLPHDAMLSEERTPKSMGGTNTGWFEGNDYVYEKTFFLDDYGNGEVAFEFEGIYHNADIYVNDKNVFFQPNGYTNFYIHPQNLKPDTENTIKIIVKNSDQPNSRWYTGTGIYRDAWLYVLPEKHILLDGVKIRTLDYRTGTVSIDIKTNCKGSLSAEMYDNTELIVSKNTLTDGETNIVLSLTNVKLWNTDTPFLYKCRVVFEGDVHDILFGVRQIEWSSNKGFLVNGERTILRGGCVHHDNGLLGACAYSYAEERKVALMKKAGYNAARSAHNPCSKAFLDAADKLGLFVLDEYTDMWYMHKTKYDYAPYVTDNYETDLGLMIDKDYNHPAVIGYSIGNEVGESAEPEGIALCRKMADYCHRLDNTRPVTCGINLFFNYLSSLGLGVYSDKKAAKEQQQNTGSAFFNSLAGLFGSKFMKFGAMLPGCDRKTRDAYAALDMAGYNYGINRIRRDSYNYPGRLIIGSESFCSDTYKFWELAKTHKNLVGDFVWSAFDYLGEVGLGSWEYKEYALDFSHGFGWITAGAGRIDITGRENAEALYSRVAMEIDKIGIAVVPVHTAREKHSPSAWKMTNAIRSWSWNGCDGQKTKVEVYARAERIELYINGKFIGSKKPNNDCRVVFNAIYYDGKVKAVAFGKSGEKIAETYLTTAGNETKLRLYVENIYTELLYIRLSLTDNNGEIKPLERCLVTVNIEGGTLLGLGNGCSYNERGYLTNTTDTYYGEALAIVKPESDIVTICAESKYGDEKIVINRSANYG